MSFKNKKDSRTSVSLPGRGLNHYTHVELDVIHDQLARHNVSLSSRHQATANHGLQVDKIDIAIARISQIVQLIAGGCGEHNTQSVQGRPDGRITELNLELKSLQQTLTLAKLTNSANLQMVNPASILIETANAQIGDCCVTLDAFLRGIRMQTNVGSIVWGWWSSILRRNALDESKLADFRTNMSDTRKLLREFMLTLTGALASRPPAPINTEEMCSLVGAAPTHGQLDDEGRNLETQRVSNHTHSRMFQDSNGTSIDGANITSVGRNMSQSAEHSTNTAQNVFNINVNGTLSSLLLNLQYGTTHALPHANIPAASLLASPSITRSPPSPTPSPD